MARCVQMGVWKWSEAEGSNGLCGNVHESSSSRCLTRGGSGVGLSRWAPTSTSYSLGQEVSGWLLPLAARTLATAPWILGIVLWALPLEMARPGGRSMFLAPGGLRRWTGQGGAPGAARSPLGVGDPQIAQAVGIGSVWLPPGPSPLVMPAPYQDDP